MTAARPLPLSSAEHVAAGLVEAIVAHVPALPGAACRAHVELYDAASTFGPGMREARRQALEVCHSCPALQACRDWSDSMPALARPHGVLAGQVVRCTDTTVAPRRHR